MRKLRPAALSARTRRMLKHTGDPVERALGLVIIARAVADHAAETAAIGQRTRTGDDAVLELRGAERVLNAALQHLQDLRADAYTHHAPGLREKRHRA